MNDIVRRVEAASGPVFANGLRNPLDLDCLYRRQMKEPLKQAKIDWECCHGFRRGLATNLERIGVRETIAAMILRHTNDRVTRKHYIKPPSIEAIAAMRQLSEKLLTIEGSPNFAPQLLPRSSTSGSGGRQTFNGYNNDPDVLNVMD